MSLSSGSMPVTGHGEGNLDSGMTIEQSVDNGFLSIAQEMFGELPEETEEVVEEEVTEEHEVEESTEEEETVAEEEEAPVSDEKFYVVTNDQGEEFEVAEDELLSGYFRQSDYTRKTQALAEERKQFKADLDMLKSERERYAIALEEIVNNESANLRKFDQVDWARLRQEDPNEFLMLQYEMNEVRDSLRNKMQARDALHQQRMAERDVERAAILEREGARVGELVEGWGSQELKTALRQQSVNEGFTEDDEDLLSHAMVIKLLNKAKAYDELTAKANNVGKKKMERVVPKVVRSGNQTAQDLAIQTKQNQDAFARLQQTGSIQDSLSIFQQFV